MGCVSDRDRECEDDEPTGAFVRLGGFWIDRHEVTVEEYRRCVQAGACSSTGLRVPVWFRGQRKLDFAWSCNWGRAGRDRHPVNCVSWHQAQTYCRWADARLPSDEEWEAAGRVAGSRALRPWGDEGYGAEARWANLADQSLSRRFPHWPLAPGYDDGSEGTAEVGSYPRGDSPLGVSDLIGNIEEWTDGWYDEARGLRSIRGASWHRGADNGRISQRYGSEPGSQPDYGGFRCARGPI